MQRFVEKVLFELRRDNRNFLDVIYITCGVVPYDFDRGYTNSNIIKPEKSFITLATGRKSTFVNHRFWKPGACIIKLVTAVIYGFRNKLECFVPGKPLQISLVLRDKCSSLLRKW
jgi:hypothetical protein